ncbi:AbrB family transcriptional regulator [Corynebacterium sp. CCUG 65737]|nr:MULTISPECIES: AbrB family transcriptional regulator [unclassified Corynebacterium]MCQ4622931.1 AbrB family transcriptional regulator [Corynebacterium sp. CCUG 70398]MCQ4626972.1 AbrB family transcriptional regulator [Corynebacterium sp. CCUG 65737]
MIVAPASVALGLALSRFNVPAAWILAAIIISGISALGTGRELHVNKQFYAFCRGIIGVLAAVPLAGVPPRELLHYLVPGLVSAAVIVGIGFFGGLSLAGYSRGRVSRETGVLSMLSGGASIMPALASELGADMRYVALTQYLRLLAVSMTLPLVASLLVTPGADHSAGASGQWWMWLLIPAVSVVGNRLGSWARLPAASVFGPLILTAVLAAVLPVPIVPPEPLAVMAFMSVGWICGGGLDVPGLKRFAQLLPATITFIVVVMASCAAMGWVVSLWLGITYFEGYLATSPGALETVLALSSEGGGGPAVVSLQLIRLICILVFAAALPKILRRLPRR